MRIVSLAVCLGLVLSGLVRTQALSVDKGVLRSVETLAKGCAKAGRRADADLLIDIHRRLGADARAAGALTAAVDKALRGKPGKFDAGKTVGQVRALAAGLARALDAADDASKPTLAAIALMLDRDLEAAHRALGHERSADGRWVEPWLVPLGARALAMHEALVSARAGREAPRRISESSVAYIESVLGKPGVVGDGFGLTVHTTMSRADTEAALMAFGRASSFTNWLLTGELAPLRLRAKRFLVVDSQARYLKLLDVLRQDARMPPEEAGRLKSAGFFWDPRTEYLVVRVKDPAELAAFLMTEGLDRLSFRPQQYLRAGLANFVCLSVLGRRLPFYRAPGAPPPGPGSLETDTLVGLRTHILGLARGGKAPSFGKAVDADGIAGVQGDLLGKATSAMEMIALDGPIETKLAECKEADAADAAARRAQFEAAFGLSVDDVDRRWQAWVLDDATSLVEALDAEGRGVGGTDRKKLLKRIVGLRGQAAVGLEKPWPTPIWNPLLDRRAAALARALSGAASSGAATPADASTPGTGQGAAAERSLESLRAESQCLTARSATLEGRDLIDAWMGNLHARLDLLAPGLAQVGFGAADGVFAFDCRSLVLSREASCTVRWPRDGMRKVPLNYVAAADPRLPIEGEDPGAWGYPITLQVYRDVPVGEVKASLFIGNPSKKKSVDCHVLMPGDPGMARARSYALLPKAALSKGTQYTVVFSFGGVAGERILWKFRT